MRRFFLRGMVCAAFGLNSFGLGYGGGRRLGISRAARAGYAGVAGVGRFGVVFVRGDGATGLRHPVGYAFASFGR